MIKKPSVFVFVVCCCSLLFYQSIGKLSDTLTWDAFGYYLYLPTKFIQSPSGIEYGGWLKNIYAKYEPSSTMYLVYQSATGHWMIRYTMGVALMEAPFFFIAHGLSPFLGYGQDGLSAPYQFCIAYGMLIYAFAGLYFLRKILLWYFNERITAITFLIFFLGTNYLQLTVEGAALTHGLVFTIVAAMIWFTIKWHENPKFKYALLIGLLAGLATLIRPSEIVVILIPLAWGVANKKTWVNKITLLRKNLFHIPVAVSTGLIVVIPQLIYWHNKTGHWFFNSYNNPGEGLDLYKPHLYNILFSFRKGWFIYTPVMLFALAGLITLYRQRKDLFFPITTYLAVSVWVVSSWTVWWYAGGSYSPRALLPVYAALSIPLGFTVMNLFYLSNKSTLIWKVVLLLLIGLNLFQMWQWEARIISREHMTFQYYKRIFGKTSVAEEDKKLLLPDRNSTQFTNERNYMSRRIGYFDFENPPNDTTASPIAGKGVFRMDSIAEYSPGIDIAYKDFMKKSYAWIITSVRVFIPDTSLDSPVLVATFDHDGKNYSYHAKDLKASQLKRGWNEVKIEMMTPEVRSDNDHLKIYTWNRNRALCYVDELVVDLYEPQNDN